MRTAYKPNVREDLYARMERLAAGKDTDREEYQWPNLSLLFVSLSGIVGFLAMISVVIGVGGWIVWQVCRLAIHIAFL